jgi:hypothetical protein
MLIIHGCNVVSIFAPSASVNAFMVMPLKPKYKHFNRQTSPKTDIIQPAHSDGWKGESVK